MKGMRAPELSNGELGHIIRELFRVCIANLMASFPPDLEDTVRRNLVKDFNAARTHTHICFYVSLKIFHAEELSCCVLQCAHGTLATAVPALQRCIQADHSHKRIRDLQAPPLLEQARACIGGTADILDDDMGELCTYLAELRFVLGTEHPRSGKAQPFCAFSVLRY